MANRVQPKDQTSLLSSISQFEGTSNSSGALQVSTDNINYWHQTFNKGGESYFPTLDRYRNKVH